jgi:ferredoxin
MRADSRTLSSLVSDAASREVLACGPESYRQAARAATTAVGCAPDRFHEESFTFEQQHQQAAESIAAPAPPAPGVALSGFRVELRHHGVTIECAPDTTILDAAAAAGLTLRSSCAQGMCGTCKSTLISGEVDMRHDGGIRPREIAAGKVLLCCSRPKSDLVVGA